MLLAKEHIFMSYHDEQVTMSTFYMSYCKGANDDINILNTVRHNE